MAPLPPRSRAPANAGRAVSPGCLPHTRAGLRLLLAAVLLAAAGRADPDANALAKFEQGEAFFDEGNFAQAVPLLEQAAAGNVHAAQARLGYMYYTAVGVAGDYAAAERYFRQAAAARYAYAQTSLAVMHRWGNGNVKQDYAEAVRLFLHSVVTSYQETSLKPRTDETQCQH